MARKSDQKLLAILFTIFFFCVFAILDTLYITTGPAYTVWQVLNAFIISLLCYRATKGFYEMWGNFLQEEKKELKLDSKNVTYPLLISIPLLLFWAYNRYGGL